MIKKLALSLAGICCVNKPHTQKLRSGVYTTNRIRTYLDNFFVQFFFFFLLCLYFFEL